MVRRFRFSAIFAIGILYVFIHSTHSEEINYSVLLRIIHSWHIDAGGDFNLDGRTDYKDLFFTGGQWRQDYTAPTPTPTRPPISVVRLQNASPYNNEDGVAVTRETILRFSGTLNAQTVNDQSIYALFGGQRVSTRLHISPDFSTVTVFYPATLPPSARIRVVMDGSQLQDTRGQGIDADIDGAPGGMRNIEFTTLTLTTLPNVAVCGRVFASELVHVPGATESINLPLAGATISVDGRENDLFAVTDSNGNFRLEPAPAGRFFVHIDGRTVQSAIINDVTVETKHPEGPYYPFVGKAWETIVDATETNIGNIFLPLVMPNTLKPVSEIEETVATFPQEILQGHPEFVGVELRVPPGSLYSDDGTRGGSVGIAPVPPDRLPGQMPDYFQVPLVITVQTDGPTNFDIPAEICFPNLPDPYTGQPLPPGAKSGLYSFNHDIGEFEYIGSMTVSADGRLICSDPGVGILAPGWHYPAPPPPPAPPDDDDEEDGDGDSCQAKVINPRDPIHFRQSIDPAKLYIGQQMLGWAHLMALHMPEPPIGKQVSSRSPAAQPKWFHDADGNGVADFMDAIRKWLEDWARKQMEEEEKKKGCGGSGKIIPPIRLLQDIGLAGYFMDAKEQQIVEKYAQIAEIMQPYIRLAHEEIPQAVEDQVAGLLNEIKAIAGGNVAEFLRQTKIQYEVITSTSSIAINGELRGNAPDYPVLYMAQVRRANGEVLRLRGRTRDNGRYQLFPPQDGIIQYIAFYDPLTHSFAEVFPNLRDNPKFALPGMYLLSFNQADTPQPDFDQDGLINFLELIYGTDSADPDTDNDGILDGPEIDQGLNPLGTRTSQTGIIATADTPGNALDVVALNDAVIVADGDRGVSVFNVFNGMDPTVISQVDTPGQAMAVAAADRYVAVADGSSGLAIVDIRDPVQAHITKQLNFGGIAQAVTSGGGLAYVGHSSGLLVSVDLASGTQLERLPVNGSIEDLALSGDTLFLLTPTSLLSVTLQESALRIIGSIQVQGLKGPRRMRLFVADGIAYALHAKGYNTYDVSNPNQPSLIANSTAPEFGWKQIVLNGSGLGIAAMGSNASDDGPHNVSLYDAKDQSLNNQHLTTFVTPGIAHSVSIYNGLAYAADGQAGLQVINYLPYDSKGIAPAITLSTNFAQGLAEEGKTVAVKAAVSDDVQVRNVEFYVDGQKVATDGNYPFEHRFIAPLLSQKPSFTLRAKASDTGGNTTWTDEITITLEQDATPPRVIRSAPRAGTLQGPISTVSVVFSEPINPDTLRAANFTLRHAGPDNILNTTDDVLSTTGEVTYRPETVTAFLTWGNPLQPGLYLISIGPPLADLVGNALQQPFTWSFRVYSNQDSDNDGLPDDVEALLNLNPDLADSNINGITDGNEDFDNDRLPNAAELLMQTDPTSKDTDGDGIPDGEEDADGDFVKDGDEYRADSDPFKSDSDEDGFADIDEIAMNTRPGNAESKPILPGQSQPVSFFNTIQPSSDNDKFIASMPVSYLNTALPLSESDPFYISRPVSYINALDETANQNPILFTQPVSYLNQPPQQVGKANNR